MSSVSASPSAAIGIDFGGTTVKIGLVADGHVVEKRPPLPTQTFPSAAALIDAMAEDVAAVRAAHPDLPAVAVGVGMPGLVDREGGIVHGLTNVRGWEDVPLRSILVERTGLPTELENDAKAMTYAEWRHGAAKGLWNVVCVTLGTGVGGGLILEGKLFRGCQGGAGEIGQMSIDAHGKDGNYGNFGALEKYVGNKQIAARAVELYAAARRTPPAEVSPLTLQTAARAGDPVALALWQEIGSHIGFMLANIVWLLNPDAIVIGGGVANAGELLFGPIHKQITDRCSDVLAAGIKILPACLGSDAGLIGAAALGFDSAQAASLK